MALPNDITPQPMTEAEYLALERQSETKHEFINGRVLAMTGASLSHNRISTNISRIISSQLRGTDCESYHSDMRVKIPAGNYVYPDLSVVCGEVQLVDDAFHMLTNPLIIMEILSDSTEAYDRGEKFRLYRTIPSLREYLLVTQHSPRLERYWHDDALGWRFDDVEGRDATLTLQTAAIELSLAEVYERVVFASVDDTT